MYNVGGITITTKEETKTLNIPLPISLHTAWKNKHPKSQINAIINLIKEDLGWTGDCEDQRLIEIAQEKLKLQEEEDDIIERKEKRIEKKREYIIKEFEDWNIIQSNWKNNKKIIKGHEEEQISFHDVWVVKTNEQTN